MTAGGPRGRRGVYGGFSRDSGLGGCAWVPGWVEVGNRILRSVTGLLSGSVYSMTGRDKFIGALPVIPLYASWAEYDEIISRNH